MHPNTCVDIVSARTPNQAPNMHGASKFAYRRNRLSFLYPQFDTIDDGRASTPKLNDEWCVTQKMRLFGEVLSIQCHHDTGELNNVNANWDGFDRVDFAS